MDSQEERIQQAEAHLGATYVKHKQGLLKKAFDIVGDKELSKDIVQGVMEKALEKIRSGEYKHKGKMIPWLYMITRNQSLDELRKRKKRNKVSFDTLSISDKSLTAEECLTSEEVKHFIWRNVWLLPKEQFEILLVRYPKDGSTPIPFRKLARILNLSINTVIGRNHKAIKKLRKLLQKDRGGVDGYKPENTSLHLERSEARKDLDAE